MTLAIDGADTDPTPDAATVTVTRADGSTIASAAAAVPEGTGGFAYTLTPAQMAQLGVLTAAWTVTIDGQAQTLRTAAEVVGAHYFTIGELRGRYRELTEAKYDAARVAAARDLACAALEDACGVSFVPRGTTEARRPSRSRVRISERAPRALLAAKDADGATIDLAGHDIIGGRWIRHGWPSGFVTITYEHGLDRPPPRVAQAAMILTRDWLVQGPISDRATQYVVGDPDSVAVVNQVTPGIRGSVFGIPEVDAVVAQCKRRTWVA